MAIPSKKYWASRAADRLIAIEHMTDKYLGRLFQANRRAVGLIQQDIEHIIDRFALNANMTKDEAIAILAESITVAERDQIIALASTIENPETRARIMARVNAPAYKARISRLEAIEASANIRLAQIAPEHVNQMFTGLELAGREMYNLTMFDIQRGLGVGFDFAHLSQKDLMATINHPWSGDHFSNRVWNNTDVVAERIRKTMEENFITGRSWRRCLDAVSDQALIDSTYAASRILRTETAYVANEMEAEAYEEAGIGEYQYVATLDARTSAICQEMDGKRYKLKDRKAGTNYPPMHPHCRSTTIAVIDGFDITKLERSSRDSETGESKRVPADMTYKEWYQRFVEEENKEWAIKAQKNYSSDKLQYEKYIEQLGKAGLPKDFESFQKMKYTDPLEWNLLKGYRNEVNVGNVSPFVGYDGFREKHKSVEKRFIGQKTGDGIEIKGVHPHFTARVIGTHEERNEPIMNRELARRLNHQGVNEKSVEKALQSAFVVETKKRSKAGILRSSRKYVSEDCQVVINSDTGILIQTNRR